MEIGLNLITIKVISEDKSQENIYNIQVTKTANLELANTNLETLAIENTLLYPAFDTSVINYQAEVSNSVNNLNILAVPENQNASVEIVKDNELKEGNNLIKIIVTAQNGITRKQYEVNVYKRNQEEELNYQKEQEENQDKLQEIYDAKKLSTETDIEQTDEVSAEKQTDESNTKNKLIVILVIIILIIIFGGIWLLVKKRKVC